MDEGIDEYIMIRTSSDPQVTTTNSKPLPGPIKQRTMSQDELSREKVLYINQFAHLSFNSCMTLKTMVEDELMGTHQGM